MMVNSLERLPQLAGRRGTERQCQTARAVGRSVVVRLSFDELALPTIAADHGRIFVDHITMVTSFDHRDFRRRFGSDHVWRFVDNSDDHGRHDRPIDHDHN